ncbi:MAG: CPBP family intramembrane metalloprotease [candidate division Zixibacteria bacterium]|nr:CPBP family intramembrane metalloprotease [candidate division Zixibacteria bacterium]MDH3938449.1 CPBP family intramembrane metalloprotease [candidate division Zixibacteria bacterium]
MTDTTDSHDRPVALLVMAYTAVYLIYLWLFVELENEGMHWITLVLIPALLLWLTNRSVHGKFSFGDLMRSVGFNRRHLKRGILWGMACGIPLAVVQTQLSRKGDEIWEVIMSGDVFIRLPMAFVLMLITAGFTEEFFFRGVLQTTLVRRIGNRWLAIGISAVLFGFYHLPYAYLNENWSTHGDFWGAMQEGVLMASVMGIILGIIYDRSKNLIAPIVCHSLFNAVFAMTMWNLSLKFG